MISTSYIRGNATRDPSFSFCCWNSSYRRLDDPKGVAGPRPVVIVYSRKAKIISSPVTISVLTIFLIGVGNFSVVLSINFDHCLT